MCVGRDIGSIRGAAVTAIAVGDGGNFDAHVEKRAGELGADQLYFVGPEGLATACQRLAPKHLIAGWTREAIAAVGKAGLGRLDARWIDGPPPLETLPAQLGVIAGGMPWHRDLGPIEAEYEGDVAEAPVPPWLGTKTAEPTRGGGFVYVAPDGLEGAIPSALQALGAHAVPPEYADNHRTGTLLWLSADGEGLPASLAERPAGARVIILPGPSPEMHDTWNLADWVLSGPWGSVLSKLGSAPWQALLR